MRPEDEKPYWPDLIERFFVAAYRTGIFVVCMMVVLVLFGWVMFR
jgi:hypothetical protein